MTLQTTIMWLVFTPEGRYTGILTLVFIAYLIFNFIVLKHRYTWAIKEWFAYIRHKGVQVIMHNNHRQEKRIVDLKTDNLKIKGKDGRDYVYMVDANSHVRDINSQLDYVYNRYNIPTQIDFYDQNRIVLVPVPCKLTAGKYLDNDGKEVIITDEYVEKLCVDIKGEPIYDPNTKQQKKELFVKMAIAKADWNVNLTSDKIDGYLKRFLMFQLGNFLKKYGIWILILGGIIVLGILFMIFRNEAMFKEIFKQFAQIKMMMTQTNVPTVP